MTVSNSALDRTALVPGVHRLIRVVDETEGPFAGALVAHGEGVAVSVDTARLLDWPGWRFSGAEHVAGVLDVRRRSDGHDALLPWCPQTLSAFVGKRRAADAPLTVGETGTVTASLIRGLRELTTAQRTGARAGQAPAPHTSERGDATEDDVVGDLDDSGGLHAATGESRAPRALRGRTRAAADQGEPERGRWWLTGDGRPVFVHGTDGEARAGAAEIVGILAADAVDRALVRLLDEVRTAMTSPRHHDDDERRWEQQLFSLAAPRPLRTDVFAPASAREVDVTGVRAERAMAARRSDRGGAVSGTRRSRRPRRHPMARRREARLSMSGATHGHRAVMRAVLDHASDHARRLRSQRSNREGDRHTGAPRGSRRRAPLVAVAVGALVLAVGLLWPDPDSGQSAGAASATRAALDPTDGSSSPSPAGAESAPPETPSADPADDDDRLASPGVVPPGPVSALDAVPGVLDMILRCLEEAEPRCSQAIAEGARLPGEGVAARGAAASTGHLVDDYGDVAVIRLTPVDVDESAQMLVLERRNDDWLVRDVYDVANQPD